MEARVAIKALDDLSRSQGWRLITEWVSEERAAKMQRLVQQGLAAQTRDELAANIRTLNQVLDAPQMLYERFADQLPTEGGSDG